jgi:hypothetical protein
VRALVASALETLVREASLLIRDAEARKEDAERLLRHVKEGKPLSMRSYTPDARPLDRGYVEAAVVARTLVQLEGDREEGPT